MKLFKLALITLSLTAYGYSMETLKVMMFGHNLTTKLHSLGLELPLDPKDPHHKGNPDLLKVVFLDETQARNEFAAAQELERLGNIDAALKAYMILVNAWDLESTWYMNCLCNDGRPRFHIQPEKVNFVFFNRWEHIQRELDTREDLRLRFLRTGAYGNLAHLARKRGLLPEGYDDIGVLSVRLPKSPSPATEVLEASSPRRESGASNSSGYSDVTIVAGASAVDLTQVRPEVAAAENETAPLLPASDPTPADTSSGLRKRNVRNG